MGHILVLAHRPTHGMCPVNGFRDLVQWHSGRDWYNEFVYGLGQAGGQKALWFRITSLTLF
jgi:hypothetical protein